MPSVVLRNATDTFVNSAASSKNYADAATLQVQTGTRYAYVFFNRAAPLGATITTQILRLYAAAAWTGSRTITVRRLSAPWKVSRTTWDNKPATTGTAVTVTVPAGALGQLIELNITALMQTVSDGAPWYGLRIETNDATVRSIYSAQGPSAYRPTLEASWTEAPDAPTTQSPSGNRAVSMSKPILSFDFTDELGDTSLAAVQVQIDAAANWVAPAFDSGEVASTDPELDLSTTAYAGLANNASTFWRVRVKDGAGLWSPWSDDEQFRRVDLSVVTIDNPAADPNDFVSETTPPIVWHFGGTQTAWQVDISRESDPSKIIATSSKQTGTETSWTVPIKKLVDAGPYRVVVKLWDNVDREKTGGVPIYAFAVRTFDVLPDVTITPVSALAISQPLAKPRMHLTWTRATAPDWHILRRDGLVIEDELTAADASTGGTSYAYDDDDALPWRQHTWAVQAVVNGKASPQVTVIATPTQRGIWLLDKGRGLTVWLAGQDAGSFALGEDATVFVPIGATQVVRRVQGQRGYEGSLSGRLIDAYGVTAAQYEADLLAMRDEPTRPVTLSLGDLSIRVILGNINTFPTPNVPPIRVASFDYWETS